MATTLTKSFFEDAFIVVDTSTLATAAVDKSIFTCPEGFACEFLGASLNLKSADTAVGTVSLMLTRQQGTEAAASGDSLLTTAFDLKGTAETPQDGNIVTTQATRIFYPGNRLGLNFTGVTDVTGVQVTAYFRRIF